MFGASVVGGLLWAAPALAQTGTVNGRIIDSTSQQPLAAVTVRLVGTERGASSREDGTFTLAAVPTGAQSLRVSRVGYAVKVVPLTVNAGTNNVSIQLRQLAATLQEVVSVGYGTQRRNAVTSAVSTVNTAEARVGVQPNVNQLIQGRAAGVQVTGNGGDPGAGAQIRIRGGSSISASDQPLYVIDGVPILNQSDQPGGLGFGNSAPVGRSPLNTLNPDDIAEISILKDASATAIYGSRGANGVVLITTKKGVAGTSTLEYNGQIGIANAARTFDVLSGEQYRTFVQQNVTNGVFSQSQLSTLGNANTDWQNSILRTARIQDHNIAFSGGSQSTQYRASVNYFDNPGIVDGSFLTRYQGRINGTSQLLNSKLNLNLNLTASQVQNRYLVAENTGGFAGGVFINAIQFNPTVPVTDAGASTKGASPYTELAPGSQQQRNPVGLVNQINDRGTTNRILGNLQGTYSILTGLSGTVNVGVDRTNGNRNTYAPTNSPLSAGTAGDAYLGTVTLNGATIQTLLTYDRPFEAGFLGRQSINVVGGYEYQNYSAGNTNLESRGFVTDANGAQNIGVGSQVQQPSSYLEYRKLSSLFARANYGIQDRYFITGVVRRDGASVFGANNKYAVFPSVSASWRVSEEPWFFRGGIINDLKLRGGYGTQGNQGIAPYQTLATLAADPNQRYPFGNTLVTGVLPNQNPNPNLRWETTAQTDVAVDYGIFKNRVTGSIEYYSKSTRDLLLTINVPQPAVVATQLQNIGRVKNAGLEANADFQVINTPGRSLSLGLVASSNRNRVISLGNSITRLFTGVASGQGFSAVQSQIIVPGQSLGTFYGPVFVRPGTAADGTNNGLDLCNSYNAQGGVTGLISCSAANAIDQDKKFLGNANPKFEGGFRGQANLGKFDASFLFRASTGFKVFNNTAAVYESKANATTGRNFLASGLTDGLGVITTTDAKGNVTKSYAANSFSSRFVEDGDFLRLQNVTIGYTANLRGLTRRATSARFYVSGDNLFLTSKYSGLDPEVFTDANLNGYAARGIDYLSYPRARTFTFGTRLGF
ncbi:SusC/RagA family TonB-linked outer membrane protein [Gemmatimonadetes bacterium T265]|nr:SusC/RagA family TonB-linked outer membrane protein [Gemmatimonadetes bacterium T265]